MPYTTLWMPTGVIWKYTGILTSEDLLKSNLEIYGDARFDDLRYQIVDLSEVREHEVAGTQMRKLAYLDMAASRSNPKIKVAVVASNSIGEELIRDYTTNMNRFRWEVQLFNTLSEAKTWVRKPERSPTDDAPGGPTAA